MFIYIIVFKKFVSLSKYTLGLTSTVYCGNFIFLWAIIRNSGKKSLYVLNNIIIIYLPRTLRIIVTTN